MYTFEPSGVSVTRTFRLDKKWDAVLEEVAKSRNISVSALLNQIVLKFVFADRYYDAGLAVTLPNKTFSSMIARIKIDDMIELGHNTGVVIPEDRFTMRGLPRDYKSVIWFIREILDKYNGLFKCVYQETPQRNVLLLRHSLGKNWSYFLSNYMNALFKNLLDIEIKPDMKADYVTICIDKKDTFKERRD
jgi:hypothetical protein